GGGVPMSRTAPEKPAPRPERRASVGSPRVPTGATVGIGVGLAAATAGGNTGLVAGGVPPEEVCLAVPLARVFLCRRPRVRAGTSPVIVNVTTPPATSRSPSTPIVVDEVCLPAKRIRLNR